MNPILAQECCVSIGEQWESSLYGYEASGTHKTRDWFSAGESVSAELGKGHGESCKKANIICFPRLFHVIEDMI